MLTRHGSLSTAHSGYGLELLPKSPRRPGSSIGPWAVDGHKWLQMPYDCGYAIVLTAAASYLPAVQEGERDPSHYVPELSRRARGFATWAMIKHLGRDGISQMIVRHCDLARRMAKRLSDEPGIAVLNGMVLNQIVVRFAADQTLTVATM